MKTIARLLGGGENSNRKMMDIYDFEDKIAKVIYEYPQFSFDKLLKLR